MIICSRSVRLQVSKEQQEAEGPQTSHQGGLQEGQERQGTLPSSPTSSLETNGRISDDQLDPANNKTILELQNEALAARAGEQNSNSTKGKSKGKRKAAALEADDSDSDSDALSSELSFDRRFFDFLRFRLSSSSSDALASLSESVSCFFRFFDLLFASDLDLDLDSDLRCERMSTARTIAR